MPAASVSTIPGHHRRPRGFTPPHMKASFDDLGFDIEPRCFGIDTPAFVKVKPPREKRVAANIAKSVTQERYERRHICGGCPLL
jgi:hypothetical protein